MIDLSLYPLRYFCKVTGEEYFGRKTSGTDAVLVNPGTGEKINLTNYSLNKKFISNRAVNKKYRYRMSNFNFRRQKAS
jgi:hypothetical protein